MPPGKNMDDWFTIFRSGLWRLFYKLSREGKARFYGEFLPLLHRTKEEVLQERDNQSMYLVYLGTKPNARGKGYARALIEHGLAMVCIRLVPINNSGNLLTMIRLTRQTFPHIWKAVPSAMRHTTRKWDLSLKGKSR
jgi:GNAT superfamily N-acetyltransferase